MGHLGPVGATEVVGRCCFYIVLGRSREEYNRNCDRRFQISCIHPFVEGPQILPNVKGVPYIGPIVWI